MFHLLSSLSSLSSLHSSTFQSQNPTSPSLAPLLPRISSHISSPLNSVFTSSLSPPPTLSQLSVPAALPFAFFFVIFIYNFARTAGTFSYIISIFTSYSISTLNISTFISKFTFVSFPTIISPLHPPSPHNCRYKKTRVFRYNNAIIVLWGGFIILRVMQRQLQPHLHIC